MITYRHVQQFAAPWRDGGQLAERFECLLRETLLQPALCRPCLRRCVARSGFGLIANNSASFELSEGLRWSPWVATGNSRT